MSLIPVDSSAIAAIGYYDGVLAVVFHTSSTIYRHPNVPYDVFLDLLNAPSKGAFYNAHIRGKYK